MEKYAVLNKYMKKIYYILHIMPCCIASVIFSHTVGAVSEMKGDPVYGTMFIQFVAFASMYFSLYRGNSKNSNNDSECGSNQAMDVEE
jgi:tetrahydromethanopterin S-methyltransferase subunit E